MGRTCLPDVDIDLTLFARDPARHNAAIHANLHRGMLRRHSHGHLSKTGLRYTAELNDWKLPGIGGEGGQEQTAVYGCAAVGRELHLFLFLGLGVYG
jgi:hypothetical protein